MTNRQATATSDAPSTHESEIELNLERHFAAPPERVFQALTDPAELTRWWGPENHSVPVCELDVRPGGAWRTCMRAPDGGEHCVSGVYREVVPPRRLVYTWAWDSDDGPGNETLVTLELTARDGGTNLVLTHRGFVSDELRDKHQGGWGSCFDCLDIYLEETST